MRILQVNHINQVAYIYGKDLSRRGHFVDVYEPDMIAGLAPLPVKLALMPRRLLDMRKVTGKLDKNYYDIVHIHWASYGVLGLMSKVPFVVHCHGDDILCPTFPPILKPIFKRAAVVMGITPDLVPLIQSIRPDALFLPGPIDTDRYRPVTEVDNEGGGERPWTILLFGRLVSKKGPEIATQGIAQFAARHPEVRVQLLDWGELKEKYKKRYGNRFEFIPPVAQDEVEQMIWSADVVVGQVALGILSLCELQAMSCAKPVICSFRYDDAYPSSPPICQAATPDEIDEHLEKLFQHPEAGAALGQKSREWVIENHDYRMLAGRLEELYQTII